MNTFQLKPTLGALIASALLASCGGGSGSAGSQPDPTPSACLALPQEINVNRDALSSEWTDVLVDNSGRLWLAGWTNGTVGQTNIAPAGDSRGVLRAFASDGSLLWDSGQRFDTAGSDTLEAIAVDDAGTVFATGRTTGSLGGTANAGQFDTFVAWGDGVAGTKPWRFYQTGSAAPQHPRRIALDDRGGVVVAGEDDDFVRGNAVESWTDAFAIRMQRLEAGSSNDRLSPSWSWQASSGEPDISGGLALESSKLGGATYLTGSNQGGNQRGMVLRKLDGNGQLLWTARYTTSPLDHIAVVRAMADGSLLIGGSVYGSFRGGTVVGQQDIFVARVSAADGQVLQSWQFGSADADWLADMKVDAAGNIIVFGETAGSLGKDAPAAGSFDLFLLKLSPDGRVLAKSQWGTVSDERANRLAIDRCGNVVAVGSSGDTTRRDAVMWFWRS